MVLWMLILYIYSVELQHIPFIFLWVIIYRWASFSLPVWDWNPLPSLKDLLGNCPCFSLLPTLTSLQICCNTASLQLSEIICQVCSWDLWLFWLLFLAISTIYSVIWHLIPFCFLVFGSFFVYSSLIISLISLHNSSGSQNQQKHIETLLRQFPLLHLPYRYKSCH